MLPPKSDRLTLSERSILLWDTRSQVETMTNEALGGWEASNRRMLRSSFNESLSVLVHSCETAPERKTRHLVLTCHIDAHISSLLKFTTMRLCPGQPMAQCHQKTSEQFYSNSSWFFDQWRPGASTVFFVILLRDVIRFTHMITFIYVHICTVYHLVI